MMSAIFQSTQKVSFLALEPHLTTDNINYQLDCTVNIATGGHLIAFDRQICREIELIAATLMTSSKIRAPELKMIARDL